MAWFRGVLRVREKRVNLAGHLTLLAQKFILPMRAGEKHR